MKIMYKTGSCLDGPEPWVLHGCNAQMKMGSGVALAVKKKYPSAYAAYVASAQHGGMKLGVISYAGQDDGKCIFNGITQSFYGRDDKRYVDYAAVAEVIAGVDFLARQYYLEVPVCVAMPKIGAGLGGGDWDTIAEIIEQGSIHFQPVVYTLE